MKMHNTKHVLTTIVLTLVLSIAVVYARQAGAANAPVLTTQDYIDIQQLNARYAVAIDECTNNGYDYAALYTDDGWFSPSRNGRIGTKWQGRDRLAEAARGSMKSCDEVPWKGIKHMYVNHVIVPSPEGAAGRIDLVAIGLDGDPHKVEHQGHYEDVYVKTSKGWLFRSRIHMLAPAQAEVSSGSKPREGAR
jgi:hypothetical protein